MHDGESLYCGYHESDDFYYNIGIWWNCDDDGINEISDWKESVYTRESHQKKE